MITKDNLKKLLSLLDFKAEGEIYSKHFLAFDCSLKVDFKAGELIYPTTKGFTVNEQQTCNLSSPENFVVFECVHRLLSQGYHPQYIELEPRWKLGHSAKSGRADILVKNQQSEPLLIIECKTAGREFEKAWKDTLEDGAQLFSYIEQEKAVDFVCLYASDIENNDIKTFQRIISHKDNAKILSENPDLKSFTDAKNVKERFSVWKHTYKQEYTEKGIFEENIQPYHIGKDKYALSLDTKAVDARDKKGKYHEFRTILRKYNVSRRENAFEVLVNLFLCKIVDETENPNDLKFYWKGIAYDNYYDLVDRLQALYKQGMEKFLKQDIVYISNQDIDAAFWAMKQKRNATKETIKDIFRQLKFFKGLDFEFIKVHNKEQFEKNAKILLEIIQMWQGLRLLSTGQNQFLGDMFEFFLDNGIKQSEGQFFTPVPICKFIVASLPLEQAIINSNEPLKTIDYACGAGHFLNEYALSITPLVAQHKQANINDYYKAIVGIEKEDRLAKVAKVSAFMYGQDDIQIIDADALDNHEQIKPRGFDCLVANPPFAVEDFLLTLPEAVRESYQLFETVNDTGNKNIQCFFLERAKQLLAPNGVAGIIVPSSILNNSDNTHIKTREILLQHFDFIAIVELGSGTFGKTGTNTVVLFMRRKAHNPSQAQHFKNRVSDFFEDWHNEQATAGGAYTDISAVQAYCQHQGIDYAAYQSLLIGQYHSALFTHELFIEYQKTFNSLTSTANLKKSRDFCKKTDNEQIHELQKRLIEFVTLLEKDKLLYFMLAQANPTSVLVVKSPSDNKEQKTFLGYEWSGAKGSEGIKYNAGESANDIITPLYNPNDRNDSNKINTLICDNFNDINSTIPEALAPYVSRVNLTDMLDFSRVEFNKAISLSAKGLSELDELSKMILQKGGKTYRLSNNDYFEISIGKRVLEKEISNIPENGIPVYSANVFECFGYIAIDLLENFEKASVLWGIDGDWMVNCLPANMPFYPTDHCGVIRVLSEEINPLYLAWALDKAGKISGLSRSNRASIERVKGLKIVAPLIEIQNKIANEWIAIDIEVNSAKATISQAKEDIEKIISNVRGSVVKLSNISTTNPSKREISAINEETIVSFIEMASVNNDGFIASKVDRPLKELKKGSFTYFRENDIIIAKITPSMENGKCALATGLTNNLGMGSSEFHVIRVNETTNNKFIFFLLNRTKIRNEAEKRMTGASGHRRVPITFYEDLEIHLPPLTEQQVIVTQIEALEVNIKQAQAIINDSKARKEAVLKLYL